MDNIELVPGGQGLEPLGEDVRLEDGESPSPERLADHFAALSADRAANWPEEKLRANREQRERLAERFDPALVVRPGDPVPPFELVTVDGERLTLESLTERGFAVLIFFRFAGCPACNIALPYYDRQLRPALDAAGIPLVGVSPQIPERLVDIRDRHALGFVIASDTDNRLARHFGITFEPDDKPAVAPGESWIGGITGTGTWELPQPAVIVIDRDRKARYVRVSPDWLDRPEASEILAALRAFGAAW